MHALHIPRTRTSTRHHNGTFQNTGMQCHKCHSAAHEMARKMLQEIQVRSNIKYRRRSLVSANLAWLLEKRMKISDILKRIICGREEFNCHISIPFLHHFICCKLGGHRRKTKSGIVSGTFLSPFFSFPPYFLPFSLLD